MLPQILSHSHKHLSRSLNQKKKRKPVCWQAKQPSILLCVPSCSSRTTSEATAAFRTLITGQSVLLSEYRRLFIFVLGDWCINTDQWGTVELSENGATLLWNICKCFPSLKSRSLATDQLTAFIASEFKMCSPKGKKKKKGSCIPCFKWLHSWFVLNQGVGKAADIVMQLHKEQEHFCSTRISLLTSAQYFTVKMSWEDLGGSC